MRTIRLGTRGSPLALRQADMVQDALRTTHPDIKTEIVVIKTSGDWRPEQGETRLAAEAGGKGLFAREIEKALIDGTIDAGVHSMKDMESHLPDGLVIPFMLPREDARDVLILRDAPPASGDIMDLPRGLIIGTASVRRAAFLKALRPDFVFKPLRGNVGTRLEKLGNAQDGIEATILALAGLNRLNIKPPHIMPLDPYIMLPAAGQGAIGIEIRSKDMDELAPVFTPISCAQTVSRVMAERAALAVLDGSCHTPIAAHAVLTGGTLAMKIAVAALDGSQIFRHEGAGPADKAEELGHTLATVLKSHLPGGILKQFIP